MGAILHRHLRFRDSFWLVPTLISLAALLISMLTTALDERHDFRWLGSPPFGYTGGADGARALLITIGGSIITVAGVAFSITIAVLALTSAQYGPRLIRNFVSDIGNQIVLGIFIATFIFCLVVLRTVRSPSEGEFVPYLSMAVSSMLGLSSLVVLIYFVAHISHTMQVMNIIASIGKDLDRAITRLYAEEAQEESSVALIVEENVSGVIRPVAARRSGYINGIDHDRLVRAAAAARVLIHVPHHPGQFVARGEALVEVVNDDGALQDGSQLARSIVEAFEIGDDRESAQDIEYYIDQLVEVAVRALSPAVNDPFTAMACIDRLGSSLRLLVRRQLPSPYHWDEEGVLRVVSKTQTVPGALDAAFNLIRQYGITSPAVSMRLIETLAVIGEHTSDPLETQALLNHVRMVEHGAKSQMQERSDIEALDERYQLAVAALNAPDRDSL